MTAIPITEAIQRFAENEDRVNDFVNAIGYYMTADGAQVETLQKFLSRIDFKLIGAFTAGVTYGVNNVVTYNGNAYLCIAGYTATATTPNNDVAHWSLWPGVTGSALAAATGGQLVGHKGRSVADNLTDLGVNVLNGYGTVADGVADDYAALQAAANAVPNDGGTLRLPGNTRIYTTSRPIKLTKRQTKVVGDSYHNTYIQLVNKGVDRGAWAGATNYNVGDLVTVYDAPTDNTIPYRCVTAHTAGTFNSDWAAGKWEVWAAFSVQNSDCSIEGLQFVVPAKGIGIAVQGAARFNPKLNSFVPNVNNSGYAILLDDRDYLGNFSPGSYTHTIGPGNLVGVFTQSVRQFVKGIISAGTGGGINASRFILNHFIGDACVHIQNGGGNFVECNLFQSQTGGNSGARPFTGGIGYGYKFGGETQFVNNYMERFQYDMIPSSSSATFMYTAHTSDASNDLFPMLGGYKTPTFGVTGEGISAEALDGLTFQVQSLTGDGQNIIPKLRAMYVTGNGGARWNTKISATGCRVGQRLMLNNDSWPFALTNGGTVDLAGAGDYLVIGQKGANVQGRYSQCSFAEFVFTTSGTWRLLSTDAHGFSEVSQGFYSFAGNNEQMTPNARTMSITGNGAQRSGCTIAPGMRLGQHLTLYANSWGVGFAAGAAVWGVGGAPILGNGAGQVQACTLVYTESGWMEISRTTRP